MKELTALSEVEIGKLSNQELCDRMDAILYRILCESYSNQSAVESFSRQNMKDFFNSKEIQLLPEKHQRNALKKCFEYLVQLEYEARIGGWVNQEIYNANYNENTSWLNTKTHIINCTANQIKITSSSIAWEKIRDLLYMIENGRNVPGGKDRTKNFREWILQPRNKFVFFAPNLEHVEKFKKYFRTPEVHGNSELPDRLLRLEKPSHEENNQPLRLINILSAMWNPLLEILNDMKPSTTAGSGTSPEFGLEWLKAIQENNLEVINKELDRIKQVMIGKSNN